MTQPSIELCESRAPSKVFAFGSFLPSSKLYRNGSSNENPMSSITSYSSGWAGPRTTSKEATPDKSLIPDSPCSMTMPIFASNPSLAHPANDTFSPVAKSKESPIIFNKEDRQVENDVPEVPQYGLALTTDELGIHPPAQHFPSSPESNIHHSASRHSLRSRKISPSPQQNTSRNLTPIPPTITIPTTSYSMTSTPYNPAFPFSFPTSVNYPSEEHCRLTSLTPTSSNVRLPTRDSPNRMDIRHADDLHPHPHPYSLPEFDEDGEDDDDDYYDYELGKPIRTHSRDPGERLGVYNPTPPASAAIIIEKHKRRGRNKRRSRRWGSESRRRSRVPLQNAMSTKLLMGAVRRMVLFQISFFVIQMLAALSIIIDVARGKPTPFGTQHVALILAAWGPLLIYGCCQLLSKTIFSPDL